MKTLKLLSPVNVSDEYFSDNVIAVIEITKEQAKKYLELMNQITLLEKTHLVTILHICITGFADFRLANSLSLDYCLFSESDKVMFEMKTELLDDSVRTEINSIKLWQDQIVFWCYVKNTDIQLETLAISKATLKAFTDNPEGWFIQTNKSETASTQIVDDYPEGLLKSEDESESAITYEVDENPEEELQLCIICGTILNDLEQEDIVETNLGKLCIGCLKEGQLQQCSKCGNYSLEDRIFYSDYEDKVYCADCFSDISKSVPSLMFKNPEGIRVKHTNLKKIKVIHKSTGRHSNGREVLLPDLQKAS